MMPDERLDPIIGSSLIPKEGALVGIMKSKRAWLLASGLCGVIMLSPVMSLGSFMLQTTFSGGLIFTNRHLMIMFTFGFVAGSAATPPAAKKYVDRCTMSSYWLLLASNSTFLMIIMLLGVLYGMINPLGTGVSILAFAIGALISSLSILWSCVSYEGEGSEHPCVLPYMALFLASLLTGLLLVGSILSGTFLGRLLPAVGPILSLLGSLVIRKHPDSLRKPFPSSARHPIPSFMHITLWALGAALGLTWSLIIEVGPTNPTIPALTAIVVSALSLIAALLTKNSELLLDRGIRAVILLLTVGYLSIFALSLLQASYLSVAISFIWTVQSACSLLLLYTVGSIVGDFQRVWGHLSISYGIGILSGALVASSALAIGDIHVSMTIISLAATTTLLIAALSFPRFSLKSADKLEPAEAPAKKEDEPPVGDLMREEFSLSPRETTVLNHLLLGETPKVISQQLFLSEQTVRTHIKNIYAKCAVHSYPELIHLSISLSHESNTSAAHRHKAKDRATSSAHKQPQGKETS